MRRHAHAALAARALAAAATTTVTTTTTTSTRAASLSTFAAAFATRTSAHGRSPGFASPSTPSTSSPSRTPSRGRGFAASSEGGGADDANPAWASSSSGDAARKEAELEASYKALFERFERAPNKQKRFLLNRALTGRVNAGDDDDASESSAGGGGRANRALMTRVIDVNRTTKVTKGGDLTNYTATVVVGNGDGVIGYGHGKAAEVGPAIDKAYRKAARSLTYVKRFDGHTIYHDVKGKFCKTLCVMLPAPSGNGIIANDTVEAICQLAGIKNIKAKIHGSHHPMNTVRAVFDALSQVESPEDVAERRGVNVFRI